MLWDQAALRTRTALQLSSHVQPPCGNVAAGVRTVNQEYGLSDGSDEHLCDENHGKGAGLCDL